MTTVTPNDGAEHVQQATPGGTLPSPSPPFPSSIGQLVVFTIAIGATLAVILAAFFHYAAKDATSVLGVVLPAVTALVGGFLGHQVGSSSGAASKKAADTKISAAGQAIDAASNAVDTLATSGKDVVEALSGTLESPPGQPDLIVPASTPGAHVIATKTLTDLTASIARIQGAMDTASAALRNQT